MPTHVAVNGLGLTSRGTVGARRRPSGRLQDAEPRRAGADPPPEFRAAISLTDGTTTVFAKGKMIAIKGSHYSRSNGDEAGTAGGVEVRRQHEGDGLDHLSLRCEDGRQERLPPHRQEIPQQQEHRRPQGNVYLRRSDTDDEGNLNIFWAGAPKGISARTGKEKERV